MTLLKIAWRLWALSHISPKVRRHSWGKQFMIRTLALAAAASLLFGSAVQAQTPENTSVATTPSQFTEIPLVLWRSQPMSQIDTPPAEGWTLPPEDWSPVEDWELPQGWPPPQGWSPSELRPSPQDWPPPQGWPSAEDWPGVAKNAVLVPLVRSGVTLIAVLLGYSESTGFCWHYGPYSQGSVRDGQKCVCDYYAYNLLRSCTWADPE